MSSLAKSELRTRMLARRREMGEVERVAACGYVCDKLMSIPLAEASRIAGYRAIRGEVDILQALNHYHARNHPIFLPTVTKPERTLQFLEWHPGAAMREGAYGVMEPVGGQAGVPDVVLVPLVAFDRRGHRLGYGAGYYDSTLAVLKAANPALLAIGVGYGFQEVDRLPCEEHDMRLDIIVTEREVIRPDPATSAG